MHTFQSASAMKCKEKPVQLAKGGPINARATTYGAAKKSGVSAFQQVFQDSGCNPDCIEAQLDAYHEQSGINNDTEVKAVVTREITDEMLEQAIEEANVRYSEVLMTRLLGAG
jgi:hypothetical protein